MLLLNTPQKNQKTKNLRVGRRQVSWLGVQRVGITHIHAQTKHDVQLARVHVQHCACKNKHINKYGGETEVSLLKRYSPFKAWPLLYVPTVFTFQNSKLYPHSSMYAPYVSQNKQRNLSYTAFNDWFL